MKNVQKFGKSAAIMAILSSAIIGGVATVSADETIGGEYKSHSAIQFVPNDDSTGPIDPIDPIEPIEPIDPIDPTEPIEPGTPGPLSIDFASSLNFGIQKITSTDEEYLAYSQPAKNAAGEVVYKPNYVQVTDNRGTAAGWNLSVTQTEDFKTTDDTAKNKTLPGATISLNGATAVSAATGTASPEVKDLVLTPGQATEVMTAAENAGEGTWISRFGNETDLADDTAALVEDENGEVVDGTINKNKQVKLAVPGKIAKSATEYKTDLVWTLSEVAPNGK